MISTSTCRCLYCNSEQLSPWFADVCDRLGYVAGTWHFVKCTECGSALLWPQPDPSELPSFYPPVYSFHPGLERRSGLQRFLTWLEYKYFFLPQYRAQAQSVLSRIRLPKDMTPQLLDVGCGRGLRLAAFQSKGFQCFGTDFQQQIVEDVKRRLGIPVACCDAASLPEHYSRESFDVITAFFLLEHVPDVMQLLSNCHALLRPGGWMVAAVPLADSLQCAMFGRRWIEVTEAPRHLSLPTRKGLYRLYQRAGFDRIGISPDSCLIGAGQFALSALPAAAMTRTYGDRPSRFATLVRMLGGVFATCAIPIALVENYVFRRPATGLIFARKPTAGLDGHSSVRRWLPSGRIPTRTVGK